MTTMTIISAANFLPINKVNQQESLAQLAAEEYFPEVPSMSGAYGGFHSMNPTALELATDNLMLKMALYDGEEMNDIWKYDLAGIMVAVGGMFVWDIAGSFLMGWEAMVLAAFWAFVCIFVLLL